jgi:antitoxin Phd
MKSWAVQDAKARFSEMLETCLVDGPQLVTKRGAEAAILVSAHEWQVLKKSVRPSLKDVLLSTAGDNDLNLPKRGQTKWRKSPAFD